MEKIKLLLYCTKSKPYLMNLNTKYFVSNDKESLRYIDKQDMKSIALNGKIVAECDFEVEEIQRVREWNSTEDYDYEYETETLSYDTLLKKSCLNCDEFEDYIELNGYAIHIKNLNIFDKPREIDCYFIEGKPVKISDDLKLSTAKAIKQAPQNMCYVRGCNTGEKYILISIHPEWIAKILNNEKTIEIRRKVLKEMINNA